MNLTPHDYRHAAYAGFVRQTDNVVNGKRDTYGFTGDGYEIMVEGAVGEYVVAKALGLFWPGVGKIGGIDVGSRVEVRTSKRQDACLILHDSDKDQLPYVLVTGRYPTYVIHGWIYGADGKLAKWRKDPTGHRPAYFVPPSALHSIESLKDLVGKE